MNFSVMVKMSATAVAALTLMGAAQAATYNYVGDTTGAPTYNRLLAGLSGLSVVGTAVHFQTLSFSVDTAGSYAFKSDATTVPLWDTFLFLYKDGFNPATPMINAVKGNDDLGGIGHSGFSFALNAGSTYIVVTTGFANTNMGAYANSISGAGNITAAVPEPESYALMALGLGVVGFLARRRRSV